MQVQIIESNRGGKIAVHDGHSYNQKQSTINCIHWRCTKYYKLKCPAILKTKNETVIETKGTHNHECDPGECKAEEVVRRIFGCSYGTWKKIRKCRSLNMFKKLPDFFAPSAPDTKKIKKHAKYPKHL